VEARTNVLDIAIQWHILPSRDQPEVMRLVAAICRKATSAELFIKCDPVDGEARSRVLADGFEPVDVSSWRYPTGRTLPWARAESIASCSADPFQTPWNLEPRQWEILDPFLTDMRRSRNGGRVPVLEIGCGFGRNSVLLEAYELEVYGIDFSHDAIRQCRRWVRRPERFLTASVLHLPYADCVFEGVLDVGCLHCTGLNFLNGAVDEIARVLRPSGRLYSRFFKPRNRHWLDAQPYPADPVGLESNEFADLLRRRFEVEAWQEPEMTCVRAVPRRRE